MVAGLAGKADRAARSRPLISRFSALFVGIAGAASPEGGAGYGNENSQEPVLFSEAPQPQNLAVIGRIIRNAMKDAS
jgi:hypothetical protein